MNNSFAIEKILARYPHWNPSDLVRRLRCHTFVSVADRFVYFEIPKAACTSVKLFLRNRYGGAETRLRTGGALQTRRDMFIHVRSNVALPSLMDLDDATQREVLEAPDFLRFAIVRNPYRRLISAWGNKIRLCEPRYRHVYVAITGHDPEPAAKTKISFAQFLAHIEEANDFVGCDRHWRLQTEMLFPAAIDFTHIGKLEQLNHTETVIGDHLRLPAGFCLTHTNRSAPVADPALDAAAAARIYAIYRTDFDAFGYDRNDWPKPEHGRTADVTEEKFIDEVIERNLVIADLNEQLRRAAARYASLEAAHDRLQQEKARSEMRFSLSLPS
jgi:Sulfotransferase family